KSSRPSGSGTVQCMARSRNGDGCSGCCLATWCCAREPSLCAFCLSALICRRSGAVFWSIEGADALGRAGAGAAADAVDAGDPVAAGSGASSVVAGGGVSPVVGGGVSSVVGGGAVVGGGVASVVVGHCSPTGTVRTW